LRAKARTTAGQTAKKHEQNNVLKPGLRHFHQTVTSADRKKGPSACRGLRTPMEKLDEIVVGEVARQVLDPGRLITMLDAYVQSAAAQAEGAKAQLARLRHDHTAAAAVAGALAEKQSFTCRPATHVRLTSG
jgi:hypothetical protein